jgi:hypothetical protein
MASSAATLGPSPWACAAIRSHTLDQVVTHAHRLDWKLAPLLLMTIAGASAHRHDENCCHAKPIDEVHVDAHIVGPRPLSRKRKPDQ